MRLLVVEDNAQLGYEISDAAYGVDLDSGTFVSELLSKTMDIDFDGI